jgi:hypothetical protein
MRRRSASIKGPYAKVRCSAASIADKLPSARCSATPHTACSTDAATARAAATAAATAATAAVPAAVPVPPPPLPGWAKAKSRTASAAASSALLTATRASGPDALPVAAAAPCFFFHFKRGKSARNAQARRSSYRVDANPSVLWRCFMFMHTRKFIVHVLMEDRFPRTSLEPGATVVSRITG